MKIERIYRNIMNNNIDTESIKTIMATSVYSKQD